MQTYTATSRSVRVAAAAIAVLASSLVLGGQLSLFEMASSKAATELAKARIAPASTAVAGRDVRRSGRG